MCLADQVAFMYPKSGKGTQRREKMVSFVNTEITLFAYVNFEGGPITSDIWFLKVKSVPYVQHFSFNWDIVESRNNEKWEESAGQCFYSWDAHPTWVERGSHHGLQWSTCFADGAVDKAAIPSWI